MVNQVYHSETHRTGLMAYQKTADKGIIKGVLPLASLSKALTLLLKLRELSRPTSLTELTRATGFNKVTTLRLLATLGQFQFVERDEQYKKFRIGVNAYYVGSGFLSFGNREKMAGIMRRLVAQCKHTITLGVLDQTSVLFVDRLDGTERVRVTVDVGSRTPAYASASGKALLAGLCDDEIRKRLKMVRFHRFTPTTLPSLDALLCDIAQVRKRGYAINDEESGRGLYVLAVPVKDQRGGSGGRLSGWLCQPEGEERHFEALTECSDRTRTLMDGEFPTCCPRRSKKSYGKRWS